MLPREFIQEFLGGLGATGLHVLVAPADAFDRFLVVLALRFEVVGQNIIEGISGALPAPTGELLNASGDRT
jgi:hypothetical protein